jgi:membrane fusion protein, multidrug efflux system
MYLCDCEIIPLPPNTRGIKFRSQQTNISYDKLQMTWELASLPLKATGLFLTNLCDYIRLLTSQSVIYMPKVGMLISKAPKTSFSYANIARAATLSLAVVVLSSLLACSKPATPPDPIRAVKVMKVGASGVEAAYEYAGEVRARVESRLGFRVVGKITKRQAEVGQRVKVGQLLAQIDPQDYKLAFEASSAQVAAAATNRDLAAADYKRFAALKAQNFISGAELERRETTLKAAQAQLEQAQAQLKSQGNQTGYANLVADVSGIVTAVEAEPGQVVAAGTPVVRIAQDGARDVVFNVPEDRLRETLVGTAVTVKQWAQEGQTQGRVREVAASADPATRTFPIKVAVDAKDAPALGSTVYVYPASSFAGVQVIKLPTSALFESGKASHVWVLDTTSMTVKSTPVKVATADGNEAVIESGLQTGMQVVTAGVHVLAAGQKVTIYKDNTALAQQNIAGAATKSVAIVSATSAPSASAAAK